MKRWQILLTFGWGMYVFSYFLPVHRDGDTLAQGVLPGWQALATAMSGDGGVLGVASGITNLIVLATLTVYLIRSRFLVKPLMILLPVAALLNLSWFFIVDHPADLRIGYYAWLLSYYVIGLSWVILTTGISRDAIPRFAARSHL